MSQSTVNMIQSGYFREGQGVLMGKGRAGRRYSNLSEQEEKEIIARFTDNAVKGGVLVVVNEGNVKSFLSLKP